VAFFGWIVLGGDSGREPAGAATDASFCGATSCAATPPPVERPWAREWRWELKTYEFEHMYRD
jgi:hypothetical protein